MTKSQMRAKFEQFLATLDEDENDPSAAVEAKAREDREIIRNAFKLGVMDAEKELAELRASVPQGEAPTRKTLDAATAMSLRKTADSYDYKYQKWQGMDSTERIAAKIDAELHPDPERDIAASSPAEIEASVVHAWHALNPGVHVATMRADTQAVPVKRLRVGECTGPMQLPSQNHELVWSRD